MSVMGGIERRRLGLGTILSENAHTWTVRTGRQGRRDRVATFFWLYGVPTVPAGVLGYKQIHLGGIGQLLAGVSVFTALLFGLLILMFNTAITLRKDGAAIGNAHGLRDLISALRATTTYAIVVGMALALVLIVAATTTTSEQSTPWGFTPAIVWLFVHLALTLFNILRGFRTAFNYIIR